MPTFSLGEQGFDFGRETNRSSAAQVDDRERPAPPAAERTEQLRRAIETQIIPRLMLVQRTTAEARRNEEQFPAPLTGSTVVAFTALLLEHRSDRIGEFLDGLLFDGFV